MTRKYAITYKSKKSLAILSELGKIPTIFTSETVMVSVYSVLVDNHDIIDQSIEAILGKNIIRLADNQVSEKVSKKIDEAIQFFLQSDTIPD